MSTTKNDSLLVVGCGFPQLGLLRAARALGVPVIGVDNNPQAIGRSLTTTFLQVSTADEEEITRHALALHVRGITTTGSELALTTAAAVAHRLQLPFYADSATVYRCQAKDAMREAYRRAGLMVPRFTSCHNEAQAKQFAAKVGFPLVVKPAHGWGQRGVARIDHPSELLPRVMGAAEVSHGGGGAVLEECLEGPELSVNGWVENGRLVAYGVTDREVFPGDQPLGVMRSEIAPSLQSPGDVQAVIDAAAAGARALGLQRGPCYSQVCLTARGPVLFETAARCGGGFDADVTRLISGVDLYRRLIGIALGDNALEHEGSRETTYPAALVRFLAPPQGTVHEIVGLEHARSLPGVLDAAVYASPGAPLRGLVNAASRVGHLLCVGATREQAIQCADHAASAIAIHLTPSPDVAPIHDPSAVPSNP